MSKGPFNRWHYVVISKKSDGTGYTWKNRWSMKGTCKLNFRVVGNFRLTMHQCFSNLISNSREIQKRSFTVFENDFFFEGETAAFFKQGPLFKSWPPFQKTGSLIRMSPKICSNVLKIPLNCSFKIKNNDSHWQILKI